MQWIKNQLSTSQLPMKILTPAYSFFDRHLSQLLLLLAFIALFFTSRFNYLLFHSLSEIFSIVVSASIFVIAWDARRILENGYLFVVGVAFLFVAGIDTLHTLAYKGMNVFPGIDSNLPTQLWLAARLLQAFAFLLATRFLHRKPNANLTWLGFAGIFSLLVISIFTGLFPAAYIEGSGLTPFKIISEYVVCLMLLATLVWFIRNRSEFDPLFFRWSVLSLSFGIGSEIFFTHYVSVYADANMFGHLLKIISIYFLFKAIIEIGITRPFDLLYRDLEHQSQQLKQQSSRLTHHNELLNAIFETDPGGLAVIAGPEFIYRMANDTYRSLTLHPSEDPVGRPFRQFWPEEVVTIAEDQLHNVLETGEPLTIERYRLNSESGSPRYFTYHIRRLTWEDQPAAMIVVWETTTLEEARLKVEAANRELESFTSIASHDLQEPLRKIQAFGSRLKEKGEEQLGQDGSLYIDKMTAAAARMQTLINDLLAFSRLSIRPRQIELVNLSQVVQEVLNDLEARIEYTGGKVIVDPLPVIQADRLQMHQLLQNLIGNALKFHCPGVPPIVRVQACSHSTDTLCLEVQDNGIGFDEQYAEKIFLPFERLESRAVYEGTGMGLAICKKIVDQYGGSIQAHSQVNMGATFSITLPNSIIQ